MAKKYFLVHFSGHGDPNLQGQRDTDAFRNFAELLNLGDVSRFAFYAGLGKAKSEEVARSVKGIADGYNGGDTNGITFIIHGYSAGGITALIFASLVPASQIVYIALADAAFYRGETEYLRTSTAPLAYYLNENYFQIYENSPNNNEIHNEMTATGWINKQIPWERGWGWNPKYHKRAVIAADKVI